jgi:hypothetical protein
MIDRPILPAMALLALAAANAQAQPMPNSGKPETPQSAILKISASNVFLTGPAVRTSAPFQVKGRFRVAMRALSLDQPGLPVVAIGRDGDGRNNLLNWSAFTSEGGRCTADPRHVQGVQVYTGRKVSVGGTLEQLQAEETSSHSLVDPRRPTLLIADFDCDAPLSAGDLVTVQVHFRVYQGRRWTPATYTFVDMRVGAQ